MGRNYGNRPTLRIALPLLVGQRLRPLIVWEPPITGRVVGGGPKVSAMAGTDSDDRFDGFDIFEALVKIPRGESLSPSRRTPGWDSSLVHGDNGLTHAEIRLTDPEDETEEDAGLSDAQRVAAGVGGGIVVGAGLVYAAYRYGPRLRDWWRSRRTKPTEADPEVAVASTELVVEPVAVQSPDETTAELAESGLRMTDTERLARFLAMLAAQDFHDEQRRILATAVIEDEDYVLTAQQKLEELSPAQRVELINLLADRHPSLLDAQATTILRSHLGPPASETPAKAAAAPIISRSASPDPASP